MYIIYCHTSKINDKRYVGWSSLTIDKRWQIHVKQALNGSPCHFHRAIRLYGKDNWTHTILEECETKEDARDRAEPLWIDELDTFGPLGYNMTSGGDGVPDYVLTDKIRKRMSNSHKGKKLSDHTKHLLSKLNTGENHPMWGRKQTPEARAKISKNSACKRAVEQLTLDGNNVIARYESQTQAAKAIHYNDSTKIGLCCRGIRLTAGGFKWRHA